MNANTLNTSQAKTASTASMPHAAKFILAMLAKLQFGSLTVYLPDSSMRHFGKDTPSLCPADMHVHDWALFSKVLRGGDIAFAESYMDGGFTTSHLPNLMKVIVANRSAIEQALYGSWWGSLLDRVRHLFRSNSKAQAKKNIAAHYDLGNAFYRLWLDPSMTYSSALFGNEYCTEPELDAAQLMSAQAAKYQRVLKELGLHSAGSKVLEIGCGWGGFASVAASTGHVVKGLTLSQEQLSYANQRMANVGLAAQANLCLQDYRDEGTGAQLTAQYDGIASIEMFEAVGESYWPSYFECVARNLKEGGKACIQTIVIKDELFERYRKGTDFIQRYIFPGGMLPSPEVFTKKAQAAGLTVVNQHAFGKDYARTLAVWRLQFLNELSAVREQAYPEKFIRMWEFYLAYCEAGFVGGDIDVIQFTLTHSTSPSSPTS
jgi:cyclopropane-fatty-acyl-phospholipid synthase